MNFLWGHIPFSILTNNEDHLQATNLIILEVLLINCKGNFCINHRCKLTSISPHPSYTEAQAKLGRLYYPFCVGNYVWCKPVLKTMISISFSHSDYYICVYCRDIYIFDDSEPQAVKNQKFHVCHIFHFISFATSYFWLSYIYSIFSKS